MARHSTKNPADIAAKWATNLGNAGTSIQKGVQGVTTSPTAMAAANADGYLSGVQKAVSSGKWSRNLQAVSLSSWQNAMITKGLPRIQTGAQAGKGKVQSFMTQLMPYVQNLQGQLASTPRGTLGQNIQRMNTWVQGMAQFSYNKQSP